MGKVRLDLAMVKQGIVESREKAKALIMAGKVKVGGKTIDKAGTNIDENTIIEFTGCPQPYVSRGGLKLEKALSYFAIDLTGKVVADIGASTGGFTDCALQKGAQKVYAIDVGYGQLDWKLRNDSRVVNMERTNARYVKATDLEEQVDFVSIDVAFISLEKILPAVKEILKEEGEIIALIKPQFEAGKDKIGKKGVVKDKKTHIEVVTNILTISYALDYYVQGLTYSPVKGPEGNIEYLIWLGKRLSPRITDLEVITMVEDAHRELNDKG
ncbi:MAG: hypothetical protein VR72_05260 [Clostridiaceae bacterium BRH_c20a]|nr:MAG: hypothetical protein VR72_05260 [Clostridiaceae bacterium BRH_c20a]